MRLTIASLSGTVYEGEAISLTIRTASGEITVLDHHRPLVTVLHPGTAKIVSSDGRRRELAISGGFLEMDAENHLTVLVD